MQNARMALPPHSRELRCVLLTGFESFAGDDVNPSWLAVQALHGDLIAGHTVLAEQLPTAFSASKTVVTKLLRKHRPALVICVGLAGGRSGLSLERVAINVQDARIPDNAGAQPIDVPVVQSGPAAYFSTLPIKATLQALTDEGINAELSQTAGTFVCNHVFYAVMHTLKKQRNPVHPRGGFVHVPYLPGQGVPCMPLETMKRGLQIAIQCALTTEDDRVAQAGTLS